jgi:hypothetical protein
MGDEPRKPKPLLDKEGNPVINQFGHVVSARLTSEDKAAIDELVAKGTSRNEICKTLNIADRRLKTYLNDTKSVERIERLQYVSMIAEHVAATESYMEQMLALVFKLEHRVTELTAQVKQTKVATRRTNIGREKAEKDRRSQRQELIRLKNQMWKRTGKRY